MDLTYEHMVGPRILSQVSLEAALGLVSSEPFGSMATASLAKLFIPVPFNELTESQQCRHVRRG